MTKKLFSEAQISTILKEHREGVSVRELRRKYSFSDTTFYRWRSEAGLGAGKQKSSMALLREENIRLRTLVAEQSLRIVELENQYRHNV